ncbi:MAG: zinc-dependent metalloprotease [Gemmatimonadetes bacterium]|nr:zinc-dependent metalloprotease [Gemmatimonadota bacterium]
MTEPQVRPVRAPRLATLRLAALTAAAALTLGACATLSFQPPSASGGPGGDGGQSGPGGGRGDDEGPEAYSDVVTEDAVTDSGMFHLHTVDDQLLFEIPENMLSREILTVSRQARVPDGMGYGGQKSNTQTVRFTRSDHDENVILLSIVSYVNVASDSLPIYEAVRNANLEPIVRAFDVMALNDDSTTVVIDATPLFESDVPLFGIGGFRRTQFQIRNLDSSRTFIQWAKSFPRNVEVRHVLTYNASNPPNGSSGSVTVEMNQSMLLLPDDPMRPRLFDERVGFFSVTQTDYGRSDHDVIDRTYVTRWRLEPSDTAAFNRGELVEPVKPIVYYIDPATPDKWRPYLKAGVDDWNEAFEAAGFKNAIEGRMPPTPEEDPEFSPEDARYSVIRWFPSEIANASGPHVHDPRTGEILESDINWYHNVANLLRNWYLVQTAAANPEARMVDFDDETMGKLIRFVSAHEVGHTIGLQHNMKSSSAFPVDSLRAPGFVCREGVAPSIMDYARFNYVAQPEDEGACFDPRIGSYDRHAIAWGYRPILDAESADDERPTLDSWIREVDDDPYTYFGNATPIDPTGQTEAIGSDAMEASSLGIENLKRIMDNLLEWTDAGREGENYEELAELYRQVIGQWDRYMGHVATNIGGVVTTRKRIGQEGTIYEFVGEDAQRRAVHFYAEQAWQPPLWMVNEEILGRIEGVSTVHRLRGLMVGPVNRALDPGRLQRLIEGEARMGDDAYSIGELMDDMRAAIWSELESGESIGVYRRNLQRGHLERLEFLMTQDPPPPAFFGGLDLSAFFTTVDVSMSDIRAYVRGELETIWEEVEDAVDGASDRATKLHLQDVLIRIDMILDPDDD